MTLRAFAVLLLGVTGVSSCGQGAAEDGTGPRGTDAVRHSLQELYELTWGSPRARQAVEVLAYAEFHERVAACLQEQGLAYTPAPFVDATSPSPPALSWFDALPPADARKASTMGFEAERPVAQVLTPGKRWAGRPASPVQIQACEAQAPALGGVPAVDPDLDDELYRLVSTQVTSTPQAAPAVYRECMGRAGHVVEDRASLADSFAGRPAGQAVTASERRAATADARCRSSAHTRVMAALDAPLQEFEAANADRLAELVTRPDELQADARRAAQGLGLAVSWL